MLRRLMKWLRKRRVRVELSRLPLLHHRRKRRLERLLAVLR
jgi:hypothetical protein